MLLRDAEQRANLLMQRWGLHHRGWSFKFDNARSRFGQCRYYDKTITLSKHLVGLNNVDAVEETILHEIAHAMAGPGTHHGEEWKRWCLKVGCAPVACYDSTAVARAPHKWEGHCPYDDCNMVYKRLRLRKIAKYATCGKCNRKDKGPLLWYRVEPPMKRGTVLELLDELPEGLEQG